MKKYPISIAMIQTSGTGNESDGFRGKLIP